jgi:hypothetical protein
VVISWQHFQEQKNSLASPPIPADGGSSGRLFVHPNSRAIAKYNAHRFHLLCGQSSFGSQLPLTFTLAALRYVSMVNFTQ